MNLKINQKHVFIYSPAVLTGRVHAEQSEAPCFFHRLSDCSKTFDYDYSFAAAYELLWAPGEKERSCSIEISTVYKCVCRFSPNMNVISFGLDLVPWV